MSGENTLTFASLALAPEVNQGLKSMDLKPLSPVEAKVIPLLLAGKSVIAVSPTGTGKTFSYLIPILDSFARKGNDGATQAIVMVPTAVLGFQVKDTAKTLAKNFGLKDFTAVFFGSNKELAAAKRSPVLAIVTPPLFKTLSKSLNLSQVERIIIDEGDMILFDGFESEMNQACDSLPKAKKSFFSASLGSQWLTRVKKMCQADETVDLSNGHVNGSNIKHVLVDLRGLTRPQALAKVVTDPDVASGKAMIFVSQRREIKEVCDVLESLKIPYVSMAGDLDKGAIEKRVKEFRSDKVNFMVATDYASRGLDLPEVKRSISYTLPKDLYYYFHRAGRTGRFNAPGLSLVLCGKDDMQTARGLQRKGAGFSFMAVKKEGLVEVKSKPQSRAYKTEDSPYLKKAILKAKLQHPKGKVKPGYKKKIQTAIKVAKIKHKKKIIRTNLAKKDLTHGV